MDPFTVWALAGQAVIKGMKMRTRKTEIDPTPCGRFLRMLIALLGTA
jgi:hypothetical protein